MSSPGTASSSGSHRIHPPPSNIRNTNPYPNPHHRIHPPPQPYHQPHPYATTGYYLPHPVWRDHPHHLPHIERPPSTEHEDGHVIGQEHEHITPHPFSSYMYPAQLPLPTPHHVPMPLGEIDTNTIPTPGGSRSYQHQQEYEPHPGYEHDYEVGEDEISPALSGRMMKELASPSLIDPELEDEEVESEQEPDQDQEDEYKPLRTKKGKGKAAGGGVKKGRGKAKSKKGKGKGKGKADTKPKIPAASLRRTTARATAIRPTTTSKTYPSDDDTPYEARDTDSHIDVAYFPNLRNITYPLLAPPPGTHLDVNDLLILHPPALSSDESHVPINQYNKGNPPEGSRWEMYTCRGCRKTYDGKNARSVARRHLQDKHGIPLSQQARRTRWDAEGNRPINEEEAKERSRKCKRDWAKVTRQQRSLEKLHSDFLLQFGPAGLKTDWKHPLIAPLYRDSNQTFFLSEDEEPWKTADEVTIPRSLTESVSILAKLEHAVEFNTSLPFVSFEDLLQLDSDTDTDVPRDRKKKKITSNGSLLTLPTSPLRPNFQPYTSTPDSVREPPAAQPNQTQFPDDQYGPTPSTQEPATLASFTATGTAAALLRKRRNTRLDSSPATSATSSAHTSPEVGDYTLRPVPIGDPVQEEEDEDAHPPLWVEPTWQRWAEVSTNSSTSLRAIGQALLAEDQQIGVEVPSIQLDDKALNGEAAETLLDLHSTPVRADESSRSPTPEPVDAALLVHARLAIQEEEERGSRSRSNPRPRPHASPATQEPWMNGIAGLIASYSSASDPARATYLRHASQSRAKQPFLSRPGHLQRSLSGTITLDDPFVLDSAGTPPQSRASGSGSGRSNHHHLTGSPVVRRDSGSKRKPSASPVNRIMRAPLHPITNRSHSTGHSSQSPKKGDFQTPLRPSRTVANGHAPMTGPGMGWMQFSSPADPAASLGLAPTHDVPTTPGLSMIIGQDTPVGGKRALGQGR